MEDQGQPVGPREIPRIIHRIWLGSNPMPEHHAEYGESWRRHHPEWEMRLWTEDDLAGLDLPDAFERTSHPVTRSDVLRLEVLRRFGGVYVDTDIECLRPIDSLVEGITAFAAYQQPSRDLINNGLIGSVPGHPTIERAVREAMENIGPEYSLAAAATEFVTPIFEESPDFVVFGNEKFHPYSPVEPWRDGDEFPEAYAVHHWAGGWKSREYYQDRVGRLQTRLHRARSKLERARDRNARLTERIDAAERRLAAIESSPWWRARGRFAKLLGPATRPLRRAIRRR